jgi:predicted nucleic acid-binding protein
VSVVSNSSPLIALSAINSLHLLHALYGTIYIPEAVFQEVVVRGAGWPGGTAVANAPWLVRHPVTNQQTVAQLLSAGLDKGESEAIVLASELSAGLLILDESHARTVARQRGLPVTGTLGVLIAAKNAGMVAAIKPLLGQLSAAGFYISPLIIAHALLLAGE